MKFNRSHLPTFWLSALLLFTWQSITANELDAVLPKLESDRDAALATYKETVEAINQEKLLLVREATELDRTVIERKEQLRLLDLEKLEREQTQLLAEETLSELENVSAYVDGVLREFSNKFLSRIDFSEQQRFLKEVTEINESLRLESGSYDQNIAAQLDVVELSIGLLEQSIGGYRFEGSSLSPQGILKSGTIIRFGPASYFASDEKTASGLLVPNAGTIEPKTVPLTAENNLNISSLALAKEGYLAIDTSLNALKLDRERGSTWQHLQKGGWVGYVIMSLGAISLVLVLAKIASIKSEAPATPDNISAIVSHAQSEDYDNAAKSISESCSSVRTLLTAGIKNTNQTVDLLEESLLSEVLEYKLRLERFIPVLALTAATAPLLGLLGTVVGMIKTFTLITVFGTGDAKSLSSGISEALVTTELGLIIAVPALILHGLVMHMIQTRTAAMERIAFEYVKEVKRIPDKG
ncbi:MotA/TolQ/ExbB proton channel family protein [Pelagicoccus albus]|uniref:MotA/TolQ/ExbB proton channel family protein n=1 Tax=Pelagicoccus albus TaxID=415222 RepID=A0A7X1B2Q4_9BACT|nr:MotA/TolQ/ExbB proton channel family protein [Pelagicoccus albus]MBC2604574.1 MotA/TolQ/ExbB proton channel family protein [Pelagicoccus albus]